MAMALLQQYTAGYSKRCRGLALDVASAILQVGGDMFELPLWLKELCMFGIPDDANAESKSCRNGLFAQQSTPQGTFVGDPARLMRLFIKHHQYEEACDVVVAVLAQNAKTATSRRLPEKGSIDYVPYDLIDLLWNIIDSILASHSDPATEVQSQLTSLTKKRRHMKTALTQHFASLVISEEGLQSARSLTVLC